MSAVTPAQAAYERHQANMRRRFPGIAPIAWEELNEEAGAKADWADVASDAIDARVAAIVTAAAGDTVIVAFTDAVTAHEAEELMDRWAEYGPEDAPLVVVESVAGIAVATSAEVSKHRTRLAMLLADTPFDFRPDWAGEYDDAAPRDGLVEPLAEDRQTKEEASGNA